MRKETIAFFLILCILGSCQFSGSPESPLSMERSNALLGTWKLVSNEMITNGQSESVYPVEGQEMIKIFNEDHFAFFKHDVQKGKGENAVFESGGGRYSLQGTAYQEKLEYCNYREWENHEFSFQLTIQEDTLVQRGVEKIDSLNVNREIIETYVRLRN